MRFLASLLFLWTCPGVLALDNGLALTPPMGWLTWERFRCVIDCRTRPDECISERLITRTADELVAGGYLAAGYNYVGIDDCWLEKERDSNGKLVPDRERFPRGMKFIADYLHSKGLKFGIYEDFGNKTCAGYPGSLNYLEKDAATFAEWDVDYVKLDGCYVDINLMDEGYPKFGKLLNETGRPMLYSCSWPVYQEELGMMPDFQSIIKHCNMWRNYDDIEDSWSSVEDIIEYFGNRSVRLATYAGPGHWNDPDMLIIGNFGLSYEQSKVQMAIWGILAAPLLISTDLSRIRPEFKEILLNEKLISFNQDPLGRAGTRLLKEGRFSVWKREVVPVVRGKASSVIAFVNHNIDGIPRSKTFTSAGLGLDGTLEYRVEDLLPSETQSWKVEYDAGAKTFNVTAIVNPTGVALLKFSIKE